MKRTASIMVAVLVLAGLMVAVAPSQSYAQRTDGDDDTMHVSAIDMWYTEFRNMYIVYAEVAIADGDGNPVKGARVYVTITPQETLVEMYRSGTTGKDGTAIVSIRSRNEDEYVSTVTDVTHRLFTYAPEDDVVDSGSVTIPNDP